MNFIDIAKYGEIWAGIVRIEEEEIARRRRVGYDVGILEGDSFPHRMGSTGRSLRGG